MAAFNRSMMMGNVTQEPTLSYTQQQTPVVDLSMAVNRKWKDSAGQQQESVCYIDVRAYGKLAENVNKYVQKGSLIFVDGRLDYETWETKDQPPKKRSKHRLIAETVQFLSSGNT